MLLSTLAVLSLSSLLVAAPAEDPASLLPEDTLIFFGSTSLHASWEASQNTAMARILAEPEVRSFLHQPVSAANAVLGAGLQLLSSDIASAQAAATELGLESDIDLNSFQFTLESSEPPIGRLFLALTHVSLPGIDGKAPPDVGLVFGIELLDDEMVAEVQQLWSLVPGESSQGTHAGVEFLSKPIPETPFSVHLAILDNLALISTSETAVRGVIDRHQGTASGGSLASSASYQKVLEVAGGLLPGGSSCLMRVGSLAGLARTGLIMGLSQDSSISPENVSMILSVYDSLGLAAIDMVGGVSAVGSDGLVYSTSALAIDENAPGLMAKLIRGGSAVDTGLTEQMPADCLSAAASAIGTRLVDAYDFAWDLFRELQPEEAAQAQATISALLGGADLRNDLLGNVQGTVRAFAIQGQGLMGTPDSIITIGLADPQAFVTVLGNVLDAIAAQSGMALSLKDSDHEGLPFYEIDLSSTPLGMAMQPAFAIRDGEMVFGTNVRGLKNYLTNGLGDAERLSGNERFSSFLDGLAARGDVEAFSFSDLAENFGSDYDSVIGVLRMVPGGGDLPLDMSKVPPKSVITQYLQQTFSGAYSAQGGVLVNRSVSQFQLTDFLPLAAVAGALIASSQIPGLAPPEVEPEVDPADVVRTDLAELKASMFVYKYSADGYPESLADLLKPLGDDFPQGAYPHDELPVDPWGQPYRYTLEMHPKRNKLMPKLWSIGPNGIDESGEGDDILRF